jgi:hypothetical protein
MQKKAVKISQESSTGNLRLLNALGHLLCEDAEYRRPTQVP